VREGVFYHVHLQGLPSQRPFKLLDPLLQPQYMALRD
jgi:hypothetical protein